MGYELEGRLLWCLSGSGLGTTITASGNSGVFTTPQGSLPARSPVDLRRTSDVIITVIAAGVSGTGSPSLTVTLGGFDDQGNLFGPLVSVAALTASGAAGAKFASGGRHGGAAGGYTVFPEYGQVAWVVTGTTPSFSGVEICVYSQ